MSLTVLIVDDSRLQRRVQEIAVAKAGYSVICALDGEEGLRLAREKSPDIIILDMMLPKISGPDLLHALKQDSRTASIPVIVLSALSRRNADKLLGDGASAYLEKSEVAEDDGARVLIAKIASVLHPA